MIPQIIIIALIGANIATASAKHGESRGNWNLWSMLFGQFIEVLLLYWAGTFDCFFK